MLPYNKNSPEKAISILDSECLFVTLIIQHVKRMRRTILPSVACLAAPYISTLSHKRHDFEKKKKVFDLKMCASIWSKILSEIFLILRRIQRYIIKSVFRFSCNLTVGTVVF